MRFMLQCEVLTQENFIAQRWEPLKAPCYFVADSPYSNQVTTDNFELTMDQVPSSSVAETERNLTTTDGRGFQKKNDAYTLPTDRNEHSRLDLQHEAVRIILGGELYQTPELVRAALSPRESTKRRILDIGAGSGRWYDCFSSLKSRLTSIPPGLLRWQRSSLTPTF